MTSAKAPSLNTHPASRLLTQRFVFENGIVLLVTPNLTTDIVAARLFFRAGLRQEDVNSWGLSHLVASVITKGTEQHSAAEIAQIAESVGASLGVDSSPDYFGVGIKSVSEDFEVMLALAAEILRSPTFPDQELETERKATLQAIYARKEQPLFSALSPLRAAIHGTHPYAQTSYGTLETIESLQADDLRQFHQSYFKPEEVIISVAGNVDLDQVKGLVSQYFGDWHSQSDRPPPRTLQPCQIRSQLTVLTQPQDTQQTIIALGYPAVSVHHADYLGLKFLMSYLCNGMSSRLFSELREKQGLAYEVSGFYPTRQDNTHFVTYLGTTPNNAKRALTQMRTELERLAQGGLTAAELAIAKRKWAGQYALGKQTNRQIAQILGWYEILGLGFDYDRTLLDAIQDFPLEQVHRIAQQYLIYPVCSLVGSEESIEFASSLT